MKQKRNKVNQLHESKKDKRGSKQKRERENTAENQTNLTSTTTTMNFLHPDESPAGAHGAPFGGETSASPSRLNHVDLGLHPRPPTPLDPSELLDDAIVEEYRAWKKNVPYLYDLMVTHELEWPSLTCEWLPTLVKLNKFTMHKLLLGTHTAEGEMNQLVLTQVYFPNDGATAEGGEGKVHRVPGMHGGGYGGMRCKLKPEVAINHPGEVHRARVMPHNSLVVATKTVTEDVLVFHIGKHPSVPRDRTTCKPQLVLKGHSKSGYGLAWNPSRRGELLSGSDDGRLCLWNVAAELPRTSYDRATELLPAATFEAHTDVVNDVAWHKIHAALCGSVGDDGRALVWDTRAADRRQPALRVDHAHRGGAMCIDFNHHNEFLLATGGKDGAVKLWDLRCMREGRAIHEVEGCHQDAIYALKWSPHYESTLASGSADRRVNVYNFANMDRAMDGDDGKVGPPELQFVHGGHIQGISDFSWNRNEPGTICSVGEDNVLQIWKEGTGVSQLTDEDIRSAAAAEATEKARALAKEQEAAAAKAAKEAAREAAKEAAREAAKEAATGTAKEGTPSVVEDVVMTEAPAANLEVPTKPSP